MIIFAIAAICIICLWLGRSSVDTKRDARPPVMYRQRK